MEDPKSESGSTGQSEQIDLIHFENIMDFESNDEKCRAACGLPEIGGFNTYLKSGLIAILFWAMLTTMRTEVVVLICEGFFFWTIFKYGGNKPLISTRVIKWTLDEFSAENRKYFFASPTIYDSSASWRLVFRQTSDEEASFGLILTEIYAETKQVVADIEISATVGGRDIVPGMNDIKFVQKFESEGDSGYSPPIRISFEQLKNHNLEIKCRIRFASNLAPIDYNFKRYLSEGYRPASRIFEDGIILPESNFLSKMPASTILTGTELEGNFLSFRKHPETKVFFWKIPNFSKHLKNVEFWELFSPKILVNSHGFCSMWRLQLIEIQGVFRVHMQLRSIPRGISQIKMRHLLELVDNLGECVVPKHCGSTIQYPEYLQLKDTHRVSLYRREAILERFVTKDDTLSLRISLHCEPNDTVIRSGETTPVDQK